MVDSRLGCEPYDLTAVCRFLSGCGVSCRAAFPDAAFPPSHKEHHENPGRSVSYFLSGQYEFCSGYGLAAGKEQCRGHDRLLPAAARRLDKLPTIGRAYGRRNTSASGAITKRECSFGSSNPHVVGRRDLCVRHFGSDLDPLESGLLPRRGQEHQIVLAVENLLQSLEIRLKADEI